MLHQRRMSRRHSSRMGSQLLPAVVHRSPRGAARDAQATRNWLCVSSAHQPPKVPTTHRPRTKSATAIAVSPTSRATSPSTSAANADHPSLLCPWPRAPFASCTLNRFTKGHPCLTSVPMRTLDRRAVAGHCRGGVRAAPARQTSTRLVLAPATTTCPEEAGTTSPWRALSSARRAARGAARSTVRPRCRRAAPCPRPRTRAP